MKLNVEMEIEITNRDIDDIICTALEGGVNYWCDCVEVVGGEYLGKYASDQISRGGILRFYDMEDGLKYMLTLYKFLNGIKRYIANYSNCGNIVVNGAIDCGLIDATISDIIIQLALFDEIIYG